MLNIVDASSNNHPNGKPIDWSAVRDHGIEVAIIKCSQGYNPAIHAVRYVNPWWEQDAEQARHEGIKVGFYHFAEPVHAHAAAEAHCALEIIDKFRDPLCLALDLEVTGGLSNGELGLWGHTFLGVVAEQHITSPLYSNQEFLDKMPGSPWHHKLWLASWGNRPRRNVWAWQSGVGNVAGITGAVDVGEFFG